MIRGEEIHLGKFRDRPDVAIETFDYHLDDWDGITYTWDVTRAQRIVNGLTPDRFSIEDTAVLFKMLADGASEIDLERAMGPEIDLTLPLIAVPLPFPLLPDGQRQHVVIDGWHRVFRAQADGQDEIVLALLNPTEELACRLAPTLSELTTTVLRLRAQRTAAPDTDPPEAPTD